MKMLGPTNIYTYTSFPRAKEKPWQDDGKGKIMFRIKPYTRQDAWRSQTKSCVHQENYTGTEPDLPLSVYVSPAEVWVSSGLSQWQAFWGSSPGCGIIPLGEVAIKPTIELLNR